ncbi:MAG: peptidoglycan D,D-transpeptidase FtsI family protein [Pseudomonadales bacterium]
MKSTASDWRFLLIAGLLLCLAGALVVRLLMLQVLDGDKGAAFLQNAGNDRSIRTVISSSHRGMITDRNGKPLAISTPVVSIWLNPQELLEQREEWRHIAAAAGIAEDTLARKLEANAKKEFIYLRRHLPPAKAQKILDLGIVGVYSRGEHKRFYPAGEVTAHLLGFTDIDERGVEGLELAYNGWLSGQSGSKRILQDRYGKVIQNLELVEEASHGKDIALSIDMRLQYHAYRELKSAIKRFKAKSGSVVILDSVSGEVLAMVNQPSYNPNQRLYLTPSAMRNRAMTDVLEPGSTIKPLTMVAALESGQYMPNTLIDTRPGYINVEGKKLADHSNNGVIDLTTILQKSSQVGTSKIALSLADGAVRDVLRRVGLGEPPSTGFPGESAGILPDYLHWHPLHTVTMAYGYGLSVSPLQLAQTYNVLANRGVKKEISLLKRETAAPAERVIDSAVADRVDTMLQAVTGKGGTATRARVVNYLVAGKTGTLHKVGTAGYEDSRYVSVFAGYAPASNPRLVAAIVIDDPTGEAYFGGQVAAPLFSKVMGESLRLLNIPPDAMQFAGPV